MSVKTGQGEENPGRVSTDTALGPPDDQAVPEQVPQVLMDLLRGWAQQAAEWTHCLTSRSLHPRSDRD